MNNFLPSRYKVNGNPLFTERRIELVAVALAIVLVLQMLYSVFKMLLLSAPEPLVPAAESLAFSEVRSVQTVNAMQSNEIVSRPLFWPSRRPVDAVAIAQESNTDTEPSKELEDVSLAGVFGGGPSGGIIALVDNKKHRVMVGGKLFNWTLDSMGLDYAVFTSGARKHKLELKTAKKGTASAQRTAAVKRTAAKKRTATKKRDSKKRKLRL